MSHNDDHDVAPVPPRSDEAARPLKEAGDDWSKQPPKRDWLIDAWLPAGRVAMLTGPGKVGKSRLALQLAAAIAAGEKAWLPGGPELVLKSSEDKVKDDVAVLATWEDEEEEVARRLHGMNMHAKVGKRLRYVAPDEPLWVGYGGDRTDPFGYDRTGRLSPTGIKLRQYCKDKGARLLIVDPRAAAYGLNENDRAAVRMFVSEWDRWAQDNRCAVLLIVHPPKSDGPYSGTTDWHAAVRAVWELTTKAVDVGDKKDGGRRAVRFACLDTNYGPMPSPLWLKGYPRWEVAESPEAAAQDLSKVRVGDGTAAGPAAAFKPIR